MKKRTKIMLTIVVIVLISIGFFYKYRNYVYTKKISEEKKQSLKSQVKDKSPSLAVGDYQTLNLGEEKKDEANKDYNWSSDNPAVATVDENGIVRAVKSGKATITAAASDGSKKTYEVNIKDNTDKSNFNVATEYNKDLFGTRVIVTLNGVEPADLDKYIVKYDGNEVKLQTATNTFRLFVDGNVDASIARSKVSVNLK